MIFYSAAPTQGAALLFNFGSEMNVMKKIMITVFTGSLALLFACNGVENQEEKKVDSTKVETPSVQDPAVTASLLGQFNGLEKVFDNQNWMIIQDKDTSFLYISRLNKFLAYAHNYKMQKGDSTGLRIDTIQVNPDNKIRWNWNGKHYILTSSTENTNHWEGDSSKVEFAKMDASNLVLTLNAKDKIKITKTLTLSTFLVRSFYDYQHGTKLAFEQKEFVKK
jgi:hypothetical protein